MIRVLSWMMTMMRLKTENSTVILISNLRIYSTLVNEYLFFAHFFSSFICFIYDIVQSIYLHVYLLSCSCISRDYEFKLALLSLSQKITKNRSIELTVIKINEFFLYWSSFSSYLNHHTTMKDLNNYWFSKLKKSENYESWKIDIISTLKVKDLWWIISRKLKKLIISNSEFKTTVKKKYVSTILNWEDKNDRICNLIIFSIKQRLRIHIVKIEDIIKMWFILKTQYEQLNLITLYLTIKELTQLK